MAIDDIESAIVGRDCQAVGALDLRLGQHTDDLAVGVEAVDRLVGHLEGRSICPIERIGKPDATLAVDHDVIRTVVALAFESFSQDFNLAGFQVCAHDPATAGGAELGSFATDQAAFGIERVAIGAPAVFAKDREAPPGVIRYMRLPMTSLK